MKRIDSLAQLSDLIKTYFRHGVMTNQFLPTSSFEADITAGKLYSLEQGENLYIVRKRTGFDLAYFYINDAGDESPCEFANTVIEIPHREKYTAIGAAIDLLCRSGAEHVFTRQRMSTTEHLAEILDDAVSATLPCELKHVYEIMFGNFDAKTGCIPSGEAIQQAIVERRILAYRLDGIPVGILHYTQGKGGTELRHLAVDKEYRGHGIGGALVRGYLAVTSGKSTVWVRRDYHHAVAIYEKCGFKADGMLSVVLKYK